MTRRSVNTRARGFTLLELLISLVIFGLIAAMAYSALNNVLIARSQTEARVQKLYKLQMALTMMERDVEQVVDRPIRDEYGDEKPALVGNEYGDYLLEFTHTGWLNPLSSPRSSMQRVAYSIKDEKLIRTLWYVLDRAQDSEHYDTVLMEGVKALEFRYLDSNGEWQRSWPPQTLSGSLQSQVPQQNPPPGQPQNPQQAGSQYVQQPILPGGVTVELDTKEFGKVERWFHVPG
jgi:general secretion pathway protein J